MRFKAAREGFTARLRRAEVEVEDFADDFLPRMRRPAGFPLASC